MKVYHYSRLENWRDIACEQDGKKTGLIPGIRLGEQYKGASERSAIFALLQPKPNGWTHCPDFPEGSSPWESLMRNVGKLLLEIDVDPAQTSVVEWGHREGYLRGAGHNPDFTVPSRFAHQTRLEAETAYVKSIVPLQQYVNEEMQYVIPEVLIEEHVPMERVHVSADQSVLRENIQSWPPEWCHDKLLYLQYVPGLEDIRAELQAAIDACTKTQKTKRRRNKNTFGG